MSQTNAEDPIDRAIDQAITVLNEAFDADRVAITLLMLRSRVPCNDALAEHPTIQVGRDDYGRLEVGPLGLINGLFGVDDESYGFIAFKLDENGDPSGFCRLPPAAKEQQN